MSVGEFKALWSRRLPPLFTHVYGPLLITLSSSFVHTYVWPGGPPASTRTPDSPSRRETRAPIAPPVPPPTSSPSPSAPPGSSTSSTLARTSAAPATPVQLGSTKPRPPPAPCAPLGSTRRRPPSPRALHALREGTNPTTPSTPPTTTRRPTASCVRPGSTCASIPFKTGDARAKRAYLICSLLPCSPPFKVSVCSVCIATTRACVVSVSITLTLPRISLLLALALFPSLGRSHTNLLVHAFFPSH